MARKLPSHLKIHVEESAHGQQQGPCSYDSVELMQAFTKATGWIPRSLTTTPHMGASDAEGKRPPLRQRIQLISSDPIDGALDYDPEAMLEMSSFTSEDTAWQLFEQIDALVGQLEEAESKLKVQEAQLATTIAVSIRADEAEVLSSRLEESLQRCAEQTGSDAGAVYLLNETTSQLEMRSCWGMPTNRLSQPARNLRGSMGDLEALMGNAVLLENTSLAAEWNCPEKYAAAMCLPIGSPTMPQGTIWLFSDHVRDFSATDIEIAKSTSDKVLADIERSVLAEEVLRGRGVDRQLEEAGLTQSARLPTAQPLHQDYDIAGWTFQGQAVGGNFHNWTMNRHQKICAAIGESRPAGVVGALVATSLQTVIETCWNTKHHTDQVLRRANDLLWETHDSDWRSSLAYMILDPQTGMLELSLAGKIQAFVFGSHGYRMINGTTTELAQQPDTEFRRQEISMEAGELLVFASSRVIGPAINGGLTQDELLREVNDLYDEPVSDISDHLARKLPLLAANDNQNLDRSLIILRRKF